MTSHSHHTDRANSTGGAGAWLLKLQSKMLGDAYNNNNFLYANILENQAQWRDKTNGLSNCVNVEQCVSR